MRYCDLTDRKFGEWSVLSFAGLCGRRAKWLVKCSCGCEKIVLAQELKNGNSTHCGCLGIRPVKFIDDLVYIQLTKGLVAIADKSDYDNIPQLNGNWSATETYLGKFYAKRTFNYKKVYMHQLIIPNVPEVDHINHNGLDNRRCNLRACLHLNNSQNVSVRKGLKFKGIYGHRDKWAARIRENGRTHFLGDFNSPEEAALRYNQAAIKYFGEFACLNKL